MKRMVCSGIGIALVAGLLGLPAGAQNQASSNSQSSASSQSSTPDSSLGDYARQIRKAPAPAKPKVFDNDNLPRDDKLSVVGTPAEAAASSTEATAAAAPAAGDTKEQAGAAPIGTSTTNPAKAQEENDAAKQAMWKQWGDKIAAQKDQIDLLTRELDVLQREYKIRAAAMYGDVGSRLRNSGDWDKQDAQYKQQIADKQKALDEAKEKLDDMVEDARKAGVPASIREP
jgi:hypothetical protein